MIAFLFVGVCWLFTGLAAYQYRHQLPTEHQIHAGNPPASPDPGPRTQVVADWNARFPHDQIQ